MATINLFNFNDVFSNYNEKYGMFGVGMAGLSFLSTWMIVTLTSLIFTESPNGPVHLVSVFSCCHGCHCEYVQRQVLGSVRNK